MTSFLVAGVLIAQAATCGLLGTPSSPGGCSLPSPDGGSYLLQTIQGGQVWIQQTPDSYQSDDDFNPSPNTTGDN